MKTRTQILLGTLIGLAIAGCVPGLLMHYVFKAPGWATFMCVWLTGYMVNQNIKLNNMGR